MGVRACLVKEREKGSINVSLAKKLKDLDVKRKKQKQDWVRRPEVLLCPNVPKPLHGVAPRSVLGNSWWEKTRQAAYKATNYHCLACGIHKSLARGKQWLEGHEVYSINYRKGKMIYLETVALCHYCHNYIHDGRLNSLLDQGKITHQKFAAILQHGDTVLAEAGLTRLSHEERSLLVLRAIKMGRVAPWKKWRLVLEGKEYPPKFATEKDWKKRYG